MEYIYKDAAAVARGAREVEVHLAPPWQEDEGASPHADRGTAALLELPGDSFQARNSLERLALGRVSLRAVPLPAAGFAGLRSLSLSYADVTHEAVQGVLASCGALESLTLRSCHLLTSVSVASERLRVLELVGCRAVRELWVAAPALESFAFHGRVYFSKTDDYAVPIDLGDTAMPALRDACLCHLGFGEYEDPSSQDYEYPFSYYVAHARVLALCSIGLLLLRAQQTYDETAYTDMPNLAELQLLLVSLDNEGLDHVSTFFMFSSSPFRTSNGSLSVSPAMEALADENDGGADFVVVYETVLDSLTLIKLVNFRGTRRELRLLRFFLKRAPVLEQLVLVTAEGEGAPGDEQLKAIQGRVSVLRKASREAPITVCRPSGDGTPNHAHTRFFHED